MTRQTRLVRSGPRGDGGFTVIEVLVALTLFAIISLFVVQGFVAGMGYSGQSSERAAATSVALQVMELIRASANPVTGVGYTPVARQALPLPAPYVGITNPPGHTFEMAVTVTPDAGNPNLLTSVTVDVFRPGDVTPYVTLTTMLSSQ